MSCPVAASAMGQATAVPTNTAAAMEQTDASRVSVGEPTPSQLLPAGHIEETQHETQLFLGRCGEQLSLGGAGLRSATDRLKCTG
jgi:hypothetical protein